MGYNRKRKKYYSGKKYYSKKPPESLGSRILKGVKRVGESVNDYFIWVDKQNLKHAKSLHDDDEEWIWYRGRWMHIDDFPATQNPSRYMPYPQSDYPVILGDQFDYGNSRYYEDEDDDIPPRQVIIHNPKRVAREDREIRRDVARRKEKIVNNDIAEMVLSVDDLLF